MSRSKVISKLFLYQGNLERVPRREELHEKGLVLGYTNLKVRVPQLEHVAASLRQQQRCG